MGGQNLPLDFYGFLFRFLVSFLGGSFFCLKSTSISRPSTSISKPPPPYAREKVKSWVLRRGSDFDVPETLERLKKVEKAEQIGEKGRQSGTHCGTIGYICRHVRSGGPDFRPEGPEIRAPGGAGPRGLPLFVPFHISPIFPAFSTVFYPFSRFQTHGRSRILFEGASF